MTADMLQARLDRLNRALNDQKAFLHRIPDPDTRQRAETHLHELVGMRDEVAHHCGMAGASAARN